MAAVKNWRTLALILSLGLTSAVLAREARFGSWRWQNPRPQGNPLYGIGFSDERHGLAVGHDGTILRTGDGGRSWQPTRSIVNTPLYGLALRERRAWAVGARGAIITSRNGGESWVEQKSGTKKHLYAVCFQDEKRGWAVGVEGLILATSDGGVTWSPQESSVCKHLYAVACAEEGHGVAVGA